MRAAVGVLVVVTLLAACGDEADRTGVAEPELRRELLDMQAADQEERSRPEGTFHDQERTDRLREIIDEHGWPTPDLVGEDGASAAWLIAQHSDLDLEFQQEALELMREAADDGDVDPTELAYLEDRVAANTGQPQTYGTQAGCTDDGEVQPATRIRDREHVDELRAEVGMEPLADYYAEFQEGCTTTP